MMGSFDLMMRLMMSGILESARMKNWMGRSGTVCIIIVVRILTIGESDFYGKQCIFDENILVANYNIKNFILTEQGIVVFYSRHAIADGTEHAPFFEISYDYLIPVTNQ